MSFASLGLHPDLLRTLTQRGHLRPTPIQAAAIPAALAGRDFVGEAVTGSGKTLAYVLPLLQRLLQEQAAPNAPDLSSSPYSLDRRRHAAPSASRPARALVLVPARELALQVTNTFLAYTQALERRVKVVTLHGGVSVNPQLMALRGGADVLVATPGRLLDLVARHRPRAADAAFSGLRLDHLETLVLDEADRLLEDGFADELGRVLGLLPRRRQQWLFSATFGPEVLALAHDLLQDPVQIGLAAWSAGDQSKPRSLSKNAAPPSRFDEPAPAAQTKERGQLPAALPAPPIKEPGHLPVSLPSTLVQRAVQVNTAQRSPLLRHLLRTEGWARVLVFVATRYATEHVAGKLNAAGVRAAALHGDLSQGARTGALADFRSGAIRVLVATDMASRGLHLEDLPAVLSYDLARSPATHIHRVGRTARQGAAGVAVSFIAADDPAQESHFRLIEKRQGLRVPREQVPGFEPAQSYASKTTIEPGVTAAADVSPVLATAGHPTGLLSEASESANEPAPPRKGLDPNGGIKGRRKSRKDKLREALAAQNGPSI